MLLSKAEVPLMLLRVWEMDAELRTGSFRKMFEKIMACVSCRRTYRGSLQRNDRKRHMFACIHVKHMSMDACF